jgi:cytidine deaminase
LTDKELVAAAWKAREMHSALFSKFPVGAALETDDGKVYLGANIESSSYGLSICAERVALFKAITEGERNFTRIAVAVKSKKPPVSPCGACRQLLADYALNIEVLMSDEPGQFKKIPLTELLPLPFTPDHLK